MFHLLFISVLTNAVSVSILYKNLAHTQKPVNESQFYFALMALGKV